MSVPAFPNDPPAPTRGQIAANVAVGAGAVGAPLSIVSIMLWENHTGHSLTSIEAGAIGSVGSAVLGYGWHVFTTVIDRLLNWR